MKSFTIRQLPLPVEKSLRQLARKSNKSLNKTIIEVLSKATGVQPDRRTSKTNRNVEKIFRSWSPSELAAFEENTGIFETIDEEIWK